MANTNFASLTSEQLTIWSRDFWRVARNMSFINQFAGSGPNAMVQKISELTKSEKGARAVITLLADMTGDGIIPRVATASPRAKALMILESCGSDWNNPLEAMR